MERAQCSTGVVALRPSRQPTLAHCCYAFPCRSCRVRYTDDCRGIMETRLPTRKTTRPSGSAGDDVGAAQLGRRVAENLRQRRKARWLSLDDLARSSGVSRAALSQIETCKSKPTIGVLWKIAIGLGVPMSELIGAPRSGAVVLRRNDSQLLRSADGKFESRPLAPAGA